MVLQQPHIFEYLSLSKVCMWLHIHLCVLLLRYDVGVLFGTEIRQYWWENNAKFFAVNPFMHGHEYIRLGGAILIAR